MPRQPNENSTVRLYIRPSAEVALYLDELAKIGIHGKTPSEIAKTLIGNEIERLVREGILHLRKRAHDRRDARGRSRTRTTQRSQGD